jgi:hypothetical protein
MWRGGAALVVVLVGATGAGAGEFLLANGSRVAGTLANEVLMISTGSAVIEVMAEEIAELSPQEVRLRDGRVVRGTLVGGRLKATTALGELAIRVEDLTLYRAGDTVARAGDAGPAGPAPTGPAAAGAPAAPPPAPAGAAPAATRPAPGAGQRDSAADKLHDGFKAIGEAIWEGMKEVGRAVQGVFSKP